MIYFAKWFMMGFPEKQTTLKFYKYDLIYMKPLKILFVIKKCLSGISFYKCF